jgi:hypothetical protein
VAVQEVRWDEVGSQLADDYEISYVNRIANNNYHFGTGFNYIRDHINSYLSREQCPHITTFLNIFEFLQMGKQKLA